MKVEKIVWIALILLLTPGLSFTKVVEKIIDHKIYFDENTGEIVHVVENMQNFTLTNITIIDKFLDRVKKLEIKELEPKEKKIVKYKLQNLARSEFNLTSHLTYYLGSVKHRLIPQTVKVQSENEEKTKNRSFTILLTLLLPLFIISLFMLKRKNL